MFMSRINLILNVCKKLLVVMMFFGWVSSAYAKSEDCWAEFFEKSGYEGKNFRVEGPAQLADLANVKGGNWIGHIDSLKVGPKASVTVFENINFKLTLKEMAKYPDLMRSLGFSEQDVKEDAELIFGAKSTIHDLSDFNFRNKIRSLKVDCIK
jgi:hypothetical protein